MHPGRNDYIACALLAFGLALAGCHTTPSFALVADRLRVEAKVNGQPVHLILDTGAEDASLLRPVAERLQLKITEPPANAKARPGSVLAGRTEPCRVELLGNTFQAQFRVFDAPAGIHPDEDGVLGWPNVRNNVLVFDLPHQQINFAASLSGDAGTWLSLPILKDYAVMGFEIPAQNGRKEKILVDTGDPAGVGLVPEQWRAWRTAHPGAPATITAYYTPAAGLVISEVCWADEMTLGPLHLTNVPVSIANPAQVSLGGAGFAAVLGLYALNRVSLVADGKWNVAYLRPAVSPAPPYQHNRLGAVFVPKDLTSDSLIAQVVPGSPADEAGIHNGDILLRVNDRDVTHWRSPDEKFSASSFWEHPAGTKLDLTLQRAGREFHAGPVLRDLIGPGVAPAK